MRSGDLLVASLGDDNHPIARACLYPDYFAPGIVKADCFRLRAEPSKAVNAYVAMVLTCPTTRSDLNALAQGVTRDRVNLTTLQQVRLRLPPVAEQNAVATRLAALKCMTGFEARVHSTLCTLRHGLLHDLLNGRVRTNSKTEEG